jgi:CxxC-x17-CxxC domain-containing protein
VISADKTLTCRDCGATFIFTAGEQEFYASRGFTNEPSRCPACRAARKQSRDGSGMSGGSYAQGGGGGYAQGGGGSAMYDRPRRSEMHPVVCARCGKDTQVPFVPRGDRPVYCSECFELERSGGGGGGRNRGGGGGRGRGW